MNKEFKIYPSRIELIGYDGEMESLERKVSVWDRTIFTTTPYYYKDEDKLILPGYLKISQKEMSRMKYIFGQPQYMNTYYDDWKQVKFDMVHQPRNQLQKDAIKFLLDDTQAYGYTEKMLNLPTGAGKTFCVISYLAESGICPIIMVDQHQLGRQWYDEFILHTNLKDEDILAISGTEIVKDLLSADPNIDFPFKVYIASHKTISSILSKPKGKAVVNALFNRLKIGIKIFDEAHVEWKNILNMNYFLDTERTLYLTATPSRSNANENKTYQNIFGSVPAFGLENKQDENEKYQTLTLIELDSRPSTLQKGKCKNRHGFDMKGYSDYLRDVYYDTFLTHMEELINRHPNDKIAIILHKNDMVQKLHDSLVEMYPDKTIGRFCGLVPKSKRDLEKDKDIIISTDRSLDKAITIYGLSVLISTNQFSSETTAYQLAGRLRKEKDKECFFYDLNDVGFAGAKTRLSSRKKGFIAKAHTVNKELFEE